MSPRRLPAILAILLSTAGAVSPEAEDGRVTLLAADGVAQIAENSSMGWRLTALAGIDPSQPSIAGQNAQTLSMFGRDDLIADASKDYRPTGCPPANPHARPEAEILKRARDTSIVIINESHERSEHRDLTARLLPGLRHMGYSVLAMEALSNPAPDTPTALQPSFVREPGLPYLEDTDGYYLGEAGFGRLARTAKSLGYTFLPYEERAEGDPGASQAEQIALREAWQADALAAWVAANPRGKLIVHVGYRHAAEAPLPDGSRWMASRLKAKTGIDPLTISQTTCRGGGATSRLAMPPATEPAGVFDLIVDHPAPRFVRGRPRWRLASGDVPVTIPDSARPRRGWRVVEARPDGEPDASIPMDRVAIRPGEDVALMLPPGRYRLRVLDPARVLE
jgi:hypothetical protein